MVCKHVTKKMYSSSAPIASVLQELSFFCCEKRVELHTGHVKGLHNEWADSLSRSKLEDFSESKRVRADVHNPEFWRTLCPPSPPNPHEASTPWEAWFHVLLKQLESPTARRRAHELP